MKVAVLMGGASEEREVSLATGVEVVSALREAGHETVAVDTARGVLEGPEEARIRESGVGRLPPVEEASDLLTTGDVTALVSRPGVEEADVIFVALHGGRGEDGTLQALLDLTGRPYTGSGMLGCALAMDKEVSKRLLRQAGIPTPDWLAGAPTADEVDRVLGLPVIVKAAGGGSSLRLALAHDRAELEVALAEAAGYDDVVLVERYVPGREFTVGVLGGETFPVGEIVPEHEIFDYECKYQPGMAAEIFPADIADETARSLQALAGDVHRVLRMADYSRVDFILDAEGRPWCLEANALPGMTANSLLPKAARAGGVSFPELCDRIVRMALRRHRGR